MTAMQASRFSTRPAAVPASVPMSPPAPILLFLAAATIIRILVAANSGFVDDEAYYRLWSLAPAWGYYDHAPMVAWWIWLGRHLAGDTALGLRLLAPLSLAAGSIVLWRTAAVVYGPAVASRAVVWFNATLLIGAGGVVVTPDTPLVFFWGLAVWALVELERSRNPNWWLAVGVAAGLALQSKYSALFLGAGIVLWLMIRADTRRWLGCWQIWAGGAIALALFAPVVAWNAAHEWVSFEKQFGRAAVKSFTPLGPLALIGLEAVLFSLLMTPFAVWGAKLAVRDGLRAHGAAALILPATSAPFLIYLVVHSLHATVQGNWPAPLFPAFAIMAAAAVEEIPTLSGRWRSAAEWSARWASPLGLAAVGALYLHVISPAVVLDVKRDPTAQMRGWPDFAARLDALRTAQGAGWIATSSYALTGQLSYHMPHAPVVQITERVRYAFLPPPDGAGLQKTGLYVARRGHDDMVWLKDRFASAEEIGRIDRIEKGAAVESYVVYRFESAGRDPLAP